MTWRGKCTNPAPLPVDTATGSNKNKSDSHVIPGRGEEDTENFSRGLPVKREACSLMT